MSDHPKGARCGQVIEHMANVLDGSAPPELLDHVTSCDVCRDARHDIERSERLLSRAGADFALPASLLSRLLEAKPAPETKPASGTEPAPETKLAPGTEPARDAKPASETQPASETAATGGPARMWLTPAIIALTKRWAIPAVAAAAAAVVLFGRGGPGSTSADDYELSGPAWRGTVQKLLTRDGKLEICAPNGTTCRSAREGDEVPAGSQLRTDRATLAELTFADGSSLSLDRETILRLSTRGRGGELVKGGLVADVERRQGSGVRFEFPGGHLDVLGTKFSLRADEDAAVVHVARGEVRLSDGKGHDSLVLAGEEGRIEAGQPPVTSPGAGLGEALGWSEPVHAEGDGEPELRPRALGELKAKKPGERDERSEAVRLESHAVRVKIAGSVARTEVEEVFTNQTDDVLEGIFRFPLPPDAKIERLALEVDGKLEEGAFVERERAAAIWRGALVQAAPQLRREIKDEIVWVPGPWRDPALLEWQRGGRFELRIYPIPKRGSRRVVLAYSQRVLPSASVRHYSYPLGFDPSGRSAALDFSIDVQLRGHDPDFKVKTPGWQMSRSRDGSAERLHFEARSFVPTGDFRVDYALVDRKSEVSAWGYRDAGVPGEAGAPYLALALRPKLPKAGERGSARAVALVVDASRSVFGENYRRATALAARIARDLDRSDRLTVLACDSTCRELPGGLRVPGAESARDVRRFLEHETPEGASDLTLGVARGFAALRESGRQPHVVYIGDGTATAGPTRPATIERAMRGSLPVGGRVTALGIGPESDADSLLALARGGAGTALPYVPGQPLADAALACVSALYGSVLSDVRLELPAAVSRIAPARLDSIVAGSEFVVAGRLQASELKGDAVLRGTLNGRPFEQRYPLQVAVSEQESNAFVPRLFAAARIADLERDGSDAAKREAVALSSQHSVASRYTSLLVLESEAMYKAFGLDNRRKAPEYTAEMEADGSSSSGELALSDDEAKDVANQGRHASADKGSLQNLPQPAPKPVAASPRASGPIGGGGALGPPTGSGLSGIGAPERSAAEPELARQEQRSIPKKSPPSDDGDLVLEPRPPFPRRDLIPMRRIWERRGEIFTDRVVPKAASGNAMADAERELQRDESRRSNLKKAFALSSVAGDLAQAARLAQLWVEKEPLDPEAITALADVEARRGHRDAAIRLLGSVLDVRPADTAAHKRLARLERWAGRFDLACRHAIAIAEAKSSEQALVAEAVRCSRATGSPELADALLSAAPTGERGNIERLAETPVPGEVLTGDVRLEANWSGEADIDLSLLDTEGHRVSWLGADTRSVISARDAVSTSREGLSLRGAAPGEYVLELTRGRGGGSARGELLVSIAGVTRRVPFSFDGDRKAVALLRISMQSRLVPL